MTFQKSLGFGARYKAINSGVSEDLLYGTFAALPGCGIIISLLWHTLNRIRLNNWYVLLIYYRIV